MDSFQKLVLEFMEELIFFMLILMLRDRFSHEEVNDVHKPRSMNRYAKEMLVKKCIH